MQFVGTEDEILKVGSYVDHYCDDGQINYCNKIEKIYHAQGNWVAALDNGSIVSVY